MILKEIPLKQDNLYGGFVYSLANLLNDSSVLTYASRYKTRNLTDYHKNILYHKYSSQRENPTLFIQTKVSLPTYPFSLRDNIEKGLFEFDFNESKYENEYKIYFIQVNLTKIRKHEILVIKPLFIPNEIIIVDPLENNIIKVDSDYLFGNYYVMGFSILEHKYNDFVTFEKEDLLHLL